ncbi:unknown protein [Mesoplasma florum L1]|uniref:MOLPALP family lipoprotein n=1 Tax=Mesoplasma florum (strain ATCC 33453 / NBRC 100688 / NCTC 11704 / L1) TaxID=265311 RepID=Q6F1W0_MESFL|nr:hypothetical protein [Mesoplasma florum]AAT75513.1 unknown protein [Mesoplasma florum L1]ATI73112.1 hypothetical protein CQZ69_00810 [Mesoplasma florum]AVN61515.1 hypothetical protein CG004_00810 [Mesoplasma florum]
MKKILLSLSALTIGATPAVSLLNVGQKQVITQVTSEIQKKIDETSVLFKAPIITNAQKQNSDVTTNWLNDQKVSDISNINSALSYANFNAEKYDMKSVEKTLNKIYKDKDYKYKNEDATSELIFGAADKGVSLLENSIDDDGLKAEGVNELLNWISYVSFGTGLVGAVNAKSIDKSILNLNKNIEWIAAFKNTPIPTLSKLNNEYDVYTFQDLQDFIIISIGNLLSEASGFEGDSFAQSTGWGGRTKWNNIVKKELDLDTMKKVAIPQKNKNSSNVPKGQTSWDTTTNGNNREFSIYDERSIVQQETDFIQSIVKHIINSGNGLKIEMNSKNLQSIVNIVYSISWYISSYDKYSVYVMPSDDNYLFSETKSNMTIFNEQRTKTIEKTDLSNSLSGILSLFKSVFISKDRMTSNRGLKILFQNGDKTTNNWGSELSIFLSFIGGTWTRNNFNNGLNALLIGAMAGVTNSKLLDNVKSIDTILTLVGLNRNSLGYVIGNILNATLANTNSTNVFYGLATSTLVTIVGGIIPDVGKYLDEIKKMANDNAFDHTMTKLVSTKLNVLMDYLGNVMDVFSPPAETDPPREPSTLPNKSILEFMNMGVMGITVGNVIWSGLNFINTSLSEIMKPLGLLGALLSDDVSRNYNFYVKDKENKDSLTTLELEQLLGYKPEDVFEGNTKTSDLAIVWSMMRFVNTEQGKNKVVGVSLKNSNGTSEEIIYGHKAWKMLLGLNYDEMNYYDNSLLYWANELLTNGLTSKIIQWPVKMTRKYIDYNLSDITFNRNKKMNYWSNKDLFSTQFVSYQEDSKQEVLNYKIMYKVKKDVYYTYNVSVYKENTNSKYKINSFNRI